MNSLVVNVADYTIIKEDISSICRCCLTSEELVEIFQNGSAISNDLAELIQADYIAVTPSDGFPNFLCTSCLSSLRNWHKFRVKCNDSYRFLERLKDCDVETLEETAEIVVQDGMIVDEDVKIEQIYVEEEETMVSFDQQDAFSECDQLLDSALVDDHFEPEQLKSSAAVVEVKVQRQPKGKIVYRKVAGGGTKKRYDYLRQCPICGLVIKRGLKEHIMVHNDPTGRPFKCDSCDKTYCRKENLRQHREREHLKIRFPCDVCGKVFSTKDILSVHRKLHDSDTEYKCDQCDQVFKSNKYLYKHKQKHSGVKKFVCSYCGKSFLVGEYLKDHLRIHTGERPFECRICGKRFRTTNHLRQHNRTHPIPTTDCGEVNELQCHDCGLSFESEKMLAAHRKNHVGEILLNEKQLIEVSVETNGPQRGSILEVEASC